ncbi:MAG: D-hexose-6-phosphate mutarotase [Polyangiaceae bacterium]
MSLPSGVRVEETPTGLPKYVVETKLCEGELHLHGGTVTKFVPDHHEPVLWLSPTTALAPNKAIRGGVPICFPWFGPATVAGAPQHGFARTSPFTFEGARAVGDAIELTLGLRASDATRALYPFDFTARLIVTFASALTVAFEVTAHEPLSFEVALHSYLHVGEVRRAELLHLERTPYVDKLRDNALVPASGTPVVLDGPADRVYRNAPDAVAVLDPELGRYLEVAKAGAASTIVWNPWEAKAKAMADVGDAWRSMLCVEAGNVLDNAISLGRGGTHRTLTKLSASALPRLR